jgi:hypothetical protein
MVPTTTYGVTMSLLSQELERLQIEHAEAEKEYQDQA